MRFDHWRRGSAGSRRAPEVLALLAGVVGLVFAAIGAQVLSIGMPPPVSEPARLVSPGTGPERPFRLVWKSVFDTGHYADAGISDLQREGERLFFAGAGGPDH